MYDKLSSLLSLPSTCYSLLEKIIEEEAEKSAVTSARCKTAARDLGKPSPMSQIARFGTQHMYPKCGRHTWITELRGKEEEEWKNISSTNRREHTHTHLPTHPHSFLCQLHENTWICWLIFKYSRAHKKHFNLSCMCDLGAWQDNKRELWSLRVYPSMRERCKQSRREETWKYFSMHETEQMQEVRLIWLMPKITVYYFANY